MERSLPESERPEPDSVAPWRTILLGGRLQSLVFPSLLHHRSNLPLKVPYNIEPTAENKVNPDQLRLMLQTLLADRFKLAVHRDFKPDQNVYNLVGGKNGPKFQEVKIDAYAGNRRAAGGRLSTLIALKKHGLHILANPRYQQMLDSIRDRNQARAL
jgi:uncharacterized protein (TIGR03435 family)